MYAPKWASASFVDSSCPFWRSFGCVLLLNQSSAQTHYALRVLRYDGLNTVALQHVYRATVVSHLTYAASAWHGFIKASQRQRMDSVIDRARRLGYCSPDAPKFDDLCNNADNESFSKALLWSNHVLHTLLPPLSAASEQYNLRQRMHSLQLPEHTTQLSDCNFLILVCCPTVVGLHYVMPVNKQTFD